MNLSGVIRLFLMLNWCNILVSVWMMEGNQSGGSKISSINNGRQVYYHRVLQTKWGKKFNIKA